MSQSCTIYTETEFSEVLSHLESLELRAVADSEARVFERKYFEGNLRLALGRRTAAGDAFSQAVLGTWNFVREIETEHERRQQELVKRITECRTMIGVVADPEFTETDKRLDFIFELAARFDGVIFNGFEMIDAQGRTILDAEGNSETA